MKSMWMGIGVVLLCASGCALAAEAAGSAATINQKADFLATWTTAPQLVETRNLPPAPGLSGNTLRQVVHVSCGGDVIRVHFSNVYGNGPLQIIEAHVAAPGQQPGEILPQTDRALSFAGQARVEIPVGAEMLSDPLPMRLAAMADVAITIHFGNVPKNVTGHPGSRATSYLQAGDAISAAALPQPISVVHWYVLSGVDVATGSAHPGAIVALGDSTTDGRGCRNDVNTRWPDDLERRLAAAGPVDSELGVLNQGIGGNRLLNDGLGPSVLARLDRDVLAPAGAKWVIVFEGVNDIGTGPKTNTAPNAAHIIAAYQQIIARAHGRQLKVYGATITPFATSFYSTPDRIAEWETVNRWIRTSGEFDAVIDFAAVVADPQEPTRLNKGFDSGDHLHPNEEGYRKMAAAIPLDLFQP